TSASVAHCSMPRRTTSTSGNSGIGAVFDVAETVPCGETFSVLFRFRFGGGVGSATNGQRGSTRPIVVGSGAGSPVFDRSRIVSIYGDLDQGFPVFAGAHDVLIFQQRDDMFFNDDPSVLDSPA